jgi:hypothetical protein
MVNVVHNFIELLYTINRSVQRSVESNKRGIASIYRRSDYIQGILATFLSATHKGSWSTRLLVRTTEPGGHIAAK